MSRSRFISRLRKAIGALLIYAIGVLTGAALVTVPFLAGLPQVIP